MALETYRGKRVFTRTSEPRGTKAPAAGHLFVIQKHAARRLHYDLRLEVDGVLKSWAVTRGPSLAPGEKRLAVHVEDHPLDYADFEGVIPEGQYGAGAVIVWDRGHWKPLGDWRKDYDKGHLEFELEGEKLHGRWRLIRMAPKPRDKKDNWLLIKGHDEAERSAAEADILVEQPASVKSGRAIEEIMPEKTKAKARANKSGATKTRAKMSEPKAGSKGKAQDPILAESTKPASDHAARPDPAKLKGALRAPLPAFVEPMLATLVAKTPTAARWVHEIKFDGYRLQARIEAGKTQLLTRNGFDWTAKFGKALVAAFKALPVKTALIDGEVVVENENGASDFSALQAALSEGRADRFIFYAFDLLHLDGYDLREAPLLARKEALAAILPESGGIIRYNAHFDENGELVFRHACRLSLEGVVSKLRDGPYRSGRSKDWQKSKCVERQEFVIGGYALSTTSRQAIGSLALGYYDKEKLIHVGRVGTGFTSAVAKDLYKRLARIRAQSSPFAEPLSAEARRGLEFVEPQLVAEVEFRGWTADRDLRHASFRGLREDKPAQEVAAESAPILGAAKSDPLIKLTHPDRLYWPDDGVTKEGLADYYSEVWRHMAPFVVARPLALVRCPDGIGGQCFFQKHAWRGMNHAIRSTPDPAEPEGGGVLSIEDLAGLIALVQGGALEIHLWGSTLAQIEQPDMIVMDLDPGPGAAWSEVVAGAKEIRDRLHQLGLQSFVKTSGGKGLHVVAPLQPQADWAAVKSFAKAIADAMASDNPQQYVAMAAKAKRDKRIFVDYLRNGRGATSVAPYSTRARPGAAVSTPLFWSELDDGVGPAYFTLSNAPSRLAQLREDPWAQFRKAAAPLPQAAQRRETKRKPTKRKSA